MNSPLQCLTHNLGTVLPSPWAQILLTLVAVACGAIIGTERERHDKPAGLRTLILVCLGSAVFTMTSFAFTSSTGDSGRVAAQIVTGIGFLGAGAILHARNAVSGMTTAAVIWLTAAIGMTVGAGYPAAGIALSLLARLVLTSVLAWEIHHLGGMATANLELLVDPDHGKSRIRLDRIREEYRVRGSFTGEPVPAGSLVRLRLVPRLPKRQLHEFLAAVAELPAVREINLLPE